MSALWRSDTQTTGAHARQSLWRVPAEQCIQIGAMFHPPGAQTLYKHGPGRCAFSFALLGARQIYVIGHGSETTLSSTRGDDGLVSERRATFTRRMEGAAEVREGATPAAAILER